MQVAQVVRERGRITNARHATTRRLHAGRGRHRARPVGRTAFGGDRRDRVTITRARFAPTATNSSRSRRFRRSARKSSYASRNGDMQQVVGVMLGGGDELAEMGPMQLSIASETVSQIAGAMAEATREAARRIRRRRARGALQRRNAAAAAALRIVRRRRASRRGSASDDEHRLRGNHAFETRHLRCDAPRRPQPVAAAPVPAASPQRPPPAVSAQSVAYTPMQPTPVRTAQRGTGEPRSRARRAAADQRRARQNGDAAARSRVACTRARFSNSTSSRPNRSISTSTTSSSRAAKSSSSTISTR